MLSLSKRYAVYIPTSPRPSSKIFEFFGISPSASPTSSLRQLLTRQGTGGRGTSHDGGGGLHADQQDTTEHTGGGKGWSNTEAYKVHEVPLGVRCKRCLAQFVWHFGAIWFLIPINAGLIGLLLRQILIHVLIPSDLVHVTNNGPISPSTLPDRASNSPTPLGGHGIQIKASVLHTDHPFRGQATLQTISTVFFFVDLVLFVLCSIILLLRMICFRHTASREVLGFNIERETPADDGEKDLNDQYPCRNDRAIQKRGRANLIGDLALWSFAWLTLVAFAVCIIPEMDGSEPISRNLIYGAYISWWISAAWIIFTAVLIFGILILADLGTPNSATETLQHWRWKLDPNLLFIPMALSTLSVVGALLVSVLLIPSPSDAGTTHSRTALPEPAILSVLIFSFCAVGASLFLSAILFPAMLYTHIVVGPIAVSQYQSQHQEPEPAQDAKPQHLDPRGFGLLRTGTPVIIAPPEPGDHEELHQPFKTPSQLRPAKRDHSNSKRKGMFITTVIFHLLTNLSLSSAAIQLLGASLSPIPGESQLEGSTGPGAFLTNTNPSVLSVPCILLALFLLGICVLWFLIGLVTFFYSAIKRQLRWDMALGHGIVLSLTAMGLCSVVFASELDSGFFRVVACVFLGLVVVGFVVNLAFTAGWAVSGAYRRV